MVAVEKLLLGLLTGYILGLLTGAFVCHKR